MTRKGYFFADERVTPTGLHGIFSSKREAWEWWERKGRRLGVLPALITASMLSSQQVTKSLLDNRQQREHKSSERL